MATSYQEFIERKSQLPEFRGIEAELEMPAALFPFQRDLVRWALRRGRAAIFADTGLGKTPMQLAWAANVSKLGRVLILAPLAVAEQTVAEGRKFGVELRYLRTDDLGSRITITNYEMLEHFDPAGFVGIVLDESSILKSYNGATRTKIIEAFARTPYRLACTATPAPNDFTELGNHSEFLGIKSRVEMLAEFFVHDGGSTQDWRVKGHAIDPFWRWVCSWGAFVRKPSDLGYPDGAFELPPLTIHEHVIEVDDTEAQAASFLFAPMAQTLSDQRATRRMTIEKRIAKAAELAAGDEPVLVWGELNDECDGVTAAIGDAVQVRGVDSIETKVDRLLGFASGKYRALSTKPSIAAHGLNLQRCNRMIFLGASHSYEQTYQAIRRCWRFGQTRPVDVHIIRTNTEAPIVANYRAKEEAARAMADGMLEHMKDIQREEIGQSRREWDEYQPAEKVALPPWLGEGREVKVLAQDVRERHALYQGDCVELVSALPDESIGYTIFSPPFSSLYTYSASSRDLGNCTDSHEFFEHFNHLIPELLRVTKLGRLVSFHCMLLPTLKVRHGTIGLADFRGDLIRMFVEHGWIFHSETVIWKDPVTAMQRTKALGLLYKQIKKDSTMSRQGIPDYLVTMRKPGDNPEPVTHTPDEFSLDQWQRWASPVWMDINPSDTLQYRSAREHEDERHIAPLQLEVIRRALHLWSRRGDVVLSPFAGIGSEGFVALKEGRRFVGFELKGSYFGQMTRNLMAAVAESRGLFAESMHLQPRATAPEEQASGQEP